jgi:hypothetical protein
MPLAKYVRLKKEVPERHTYSVIINSLRPGIRVKESKLPGYVLLAA